MAKSSTGLTTDLNHLWHPFTHSQDAKDFPPLVIDRARGIKLYDAAGFAYYDTISSWWTNLHGHSHPSLVKALKGQAKRLDHVNFSGFTHRPGIELIDRLRDRLPVGLQRFFYSDNGSTAVEAALKMSFQYFQNLGKTDKKIFAYFDGAYHGDTVGALSVSGVDDFHHIFSPLKLNALRLPSPQGVKESSITGNPTKLGCLESNWEEVEKILRARAQEIAAVIIEPLIFCVGGMRPYPAAFLRRLQGLCQSLGIHVIYDEVATGFGRTGSFFALDQARTSPDFICLAKGLSGGVLPLALTVTTESIYEAFGGSYDKAFFHGHSYTANPIACATGIASLKIFEKQKTLQKTQLTARILHEAISDLSQCPGIADGRYLGLIGAVDLADPETGQNFDASVRAGRRLYQASLKQGLVLRPLGDTMYWMLPLATTPAQVKDIMRRSSRVINETLRQLSREQTQPRQNLQRSPREV